MVSVILGLSDSSFKFVSEGLYINLIKLSEIFVIKKSILTSLENGHAKG